MITHPADQWRADAGRLHDQPQLQLRLAAMAGHMQTDKVAARRAALVDLLADGRPHPREEIWTQVARQLGGDPWGKIPHEALARDLRALRRGGLRVDFSRRPGSAGYYLAYPALERSTPIYDAVNWDLVERIRRLSPAEKNAQAFAAADFVLRQKRLQLAAAHANWPPAQVDAAARQQVYGVETVAPQEIDA